MLPVEKCVNKIRPRALNRREFREYCQILYLEYGDLILQCELRWLSRGQVLKRLWKLKITVHDYLELKNELPEERALLCDNNWLSDLVFSVDVTSHINELSFKWQGKNKLFPSFVNDINAFNTKLIMFVENEDLCQSPHLKEQSECVKLLIMTAWQNTQQKTSYCKSDMKVVLMILVKKKTAYSLL